LSFVGAGDHSAAIAGNDAAGLAVAIEETIRTVAQNFGRARSGVPLRA
jgi:hypothetical protein